jgi:hypothetical protein
MRLVPTSTHVAIDLLPGIGAGCEIAIGCAARTRESF